MSTGRVLAASPISASQTSPGRGFVKQVDNLWFRGARMRQIKYVIISELDQLGDSFSGLCRDLWPPARPQHSEVSRRSRFLKKNLTTPLSSTYN